MNTPDSHPNETEVLNIDLFNDALVADLIDEIIHLERNPSEVSQKLLDLDLIDREYFDDLQRIIRDFESGRVTGLNQAKIDICEMATKKLRGALESKNGKKNPSITRLNEALEHVLAEERKTRANRKGALEVQITQMKSQIDKTRE